MSQNIKIEPAHCMNPGVTVTENGVIVSAVFRGKEPCGLILYNRADKSEITVQFTDEHRFGSLYSVQITPIDPEEWCYRLFSGSTFFVDPCCRSIVQIESGGRTIRTGGFFHRPDDKLPAYHRLDLGFDFHHTSKNGHEHIWNLSLYNVYCHLNSLWVDVSDPQNGPVRLHNHAYLPILPSFSYTMKF